MKKPNKKTLILTIVAFVLVLMSLISFTFSWIDDIKLVEFQNDDLAKNGAPLKTGTDINATVNINKTDNTIDLGNMLTNDDITYEYTEGSETKRHIKYDTQSPNNTKNPDMNDINEKKGYFYESGDMHFSPCYGDGESFFFQRQGQSGYREANKDDENVNYISFTTKVSSPDASIDFWFDSMPTIQGKGKDSNGNPTTIDVSSYARYALIVDGECHVYSSTGTANTCNSALTGTTAVTGVRKTSNYTYGDNTNTTAERGANSNTLFSIKKGGTVNMTVKIWLEGGFDTSCTASNINLKIISSWAKTRKLWINDKTTGGQGESWLNNGSAKLYVTFPEFLYEINTDPAQWNKEANRQKGLITQLTKDTTTGKYYVDVPLVYNNEKMILYRCNSTGFNDDGSDAAQRSEYNVYCWNWWQTNTPNTYCDETYTLYGGSMDSTAKGYLGNDMGEVTNKGYGTWGEVEEINVYSHYGSTDYATKGEHKALYVLDFTDEDTSKEKYIYEMSRADSGTSTPWKTYVPVTSSKIQFYYRNNGITSKWGYNSWGGENPQMRPLKSTGLYSGNSTVYHFAQHYGGDQGWGYWNGADSAYLIKKGFLRDANPPYAYMYDSGKVFFKVNSSWSADSPRAGAYFFNNSGGSQWKSMVLINEDTYYTDVPSGSWTKVIFARLNPENDDLNFNSGTCWNKTGDLELKNGQVFKLNSESLTNGSWIDFPGGGMSALKDALDNDVYKHYSSYDAQVYKTSNVSNPPLFINARVFKSIIFSDGSSDNQGVNLNLFPGCFYEPGENKTDEGKWYGALNDTGRAASSGGESGGSSGGDSGGGTDIGGGSMSGFDTSTSFVFKINGTEYPVMTDGSTYKVRLPLATGDNWVTVQKKEGSYPEYGNGQSGQYYVTKDGVDLYLTTSNSNNFSIRAGAGGNFIVAFQDQNQDTIKITSILKEG